MSSYISRILQAFSVSKHVVIGTAIIESKFSEGQINSVNHFKKYHASLFGLFYKYMNRLSFTSKVDHYIKNSQRW